jgi:hypothetical protein
MSIWEGAEVISVYTRADAIEDGALVDVTETAREAGITVPTALSAGAWAESVSLLGWPDKGTQDEDGRLWDVLWLLSCAMRGTRGRNVSRIDFTVSVTQKNSRQRLIDLYAVVGPGDQAEPVITVMLPHED